MKICIPSYERYETINDKSIGLLLNYGFFPEEIDLFVANKEQYDKYKSVVHKDINIIIAVKGLKKVRDFIFNYYDQGEKLLCVDDDIEEIVDSDYNPVDNLKEIIDRGFDECQKNNMKLWGLYPSCNKYFMENTHELTTDYKFIIGNFFGCINCSNMNKLSIPDIDDYERSIRSFILYGGSVRLNRYAPRTKFRKNIGGQQTEHRDVLITEAKKILMKNYPNYLYLRRRRNNTDTNVFLKIMKE
tara:strand:+ start:460 stop:1191 length:732 start_codon:yes stop_codon:yes gene_type:complete